MGTVAKYEATKGPEGFGLGQNVMLMPAQEERGVSTIRALGLEPPSFRARGAAQAVRQSVDSPLPQALILAFYLAFFLTFYLAFFLALILALYLAFFLAFYLTFYLALRSGSAHWDLELAVEVRQCPLGSSARGSGPAVPTAIWSSRFRSGSAHWDLELAVEVRQCALGSSARGSGPAVPTGIWSSRLRSGSAHCDLELAIEVRQCPLRSGARTSSPAAFCDLELARRRREEKEECIRGTLRRARRKITEWNLERPTHVLRQTSAQQLRALLQGTSERRNLPTRFRLVVQRCPSVKPQWW
eukprot:s110_g26.t1